MDEQRADRGSGGSGNRKAFTRFRLKLLLIAFIPLSVALAFCYHYIQQRERIRNAYDRINTLVFDAHFNPNGDCILFARNGNVTDSDLKVLIPIGSGEAGMGSRKVVRLELRGSKVSDEAINLFHHAAPECELVR